MKKKKKNGRWSEFVKRKKKKKKPLSDFVKERKSEEKKKIFKLKLRAWLLFDHESLKYVCIYQNTIITQFPLIKNTQKLFSILLTHHSKIRELNDGNKT